MPTILKFDLCKICWRILCVYVLILSLSVRQLDVTCDALPGPVIGVKNTPNCPLTALEWKKRAETMDCESMLYTVKVPLKYHCLLNHWGNETLELCGEESEIIGYSCPEFNQGGNTIQANYKHKCNESDPPCPFKYNSSKVFNYLVCLELTITIDDDDKDDNGDAKDDTDISVAIIAVTIICFLAMLIISPIYFCWKGEGNKPKVTRHTTEEVKNATTGNNEMYGEENDSLTILQDEKKTFINVSN